MDVELRLFYRKFFPTSAPQIRRHQQEPVNGAKRVIAWNPANVSLVQYSCLLYMLNTRCAMTAFDERLLLML